MLKFLNISEGLMKQPKLNMETLSKPDLLMLFSILEGELEARDLVIDALKSQRKELYIQERYGRYNLSDPFLALQRDSEAVGDQKKDAGRSSSTSNPLVVLKLVVSHCRRMQEKMLAQLAAAEKRHRKVIADLEDERRRHAEDTAEGDDVTFLLEKERERLQQQLEFERSQVRRLEKEQRRVSEQLEEERAQHKQLSCALAKECKWASTRALEEGHRLTELGSKLEKEKEASQSLRQALKEEQRRSLRMEARLEEQLAEFDTEREQLRSRLKKEEAHCCQLQREVEELRHRLEVKDEDTALVKEEVFKKVPLSKTRTEANTADLEEEGGLPHNLNGHRSAAEAPASSPCSSPALARRVAGVAGSYQTSYQASINQRFHAARHKFQVSIDPAEPQSCQPAVAPHVPQDQPPAPAPPPSSPSPPPAAAPSAPTEASPVKQQARSTVTQVLSRFTGTKPPCSSSTASSSSSSSCSPFGTDYRHLVAPLSPNMGRALCGALPQGVRSPTIPRAERGNPPPIPPKKPGLAQAPASPAPVHRERASHFPEGGLPGSCGLTSSQDGVKELDLVGFSSS